MKNNAIKKWEKKLREFSPRGGSRCPICKCSFRDEYNCSHSIAQVERYYKNKILEEKIKMTNRQQKAKEKMLEGVNCNGNCDEIKKKLQNMGHKLLFHGPNKCWHIKDS